MATPEAPKHWPLPSEVKSPREDSQWVPWLTFLKVPSFHYPFPVKEGDGAMWYLYFFKPITVVLGGAKPRLQWRCPCKIVRGNLFFVCWIFVLGEVSPGFTKEPSRPALLHDPCLRQNKFSACRFLAWKVIFRCFTEQLGPWNSNVQIAGLEESGDWNSRPMAALYQQPSSCESD